MPTGFVSGNVKLHSAGDLAAAQAASADVNMLGSTVYDGLDALHVRLPSAVRTSVGVADFDTESHILVAELTFCHLKHLLACVCLFRVAPKDSLIIIAEHIPDCKQFLFIYEIFL